LIRYFRKTSSQFLKIFKRLPRTPAGIANPSLSQMQTLLTLLATSTASTQEMHI